MLCCCFAGLLLCCCIVAVGMLLCCVVVCFFVVPMLCNVVVLVLFRCGVGSLCRCGLVIPGGGGRGESVLCVCLFGVVVICCSVVLMCCRFGVLLCGCDVVVHVVVLLCGGVVLFCRVCLSVVRCRFVCVRASPPACLFVRVIDCSFGCCVCLFAWAGSAVGLCVVSL